MSTTERDAEIKRQAKVVEDGKKPLDSRALALCKIVDLRREELLAGVDPRVDRVRLLETTKMLIREKAEVVVGCTLASVMRSVKVALLSGLVIDRFKGEVDFIPRARWIKIEGQEDRKIKELWADPNFRGMIHYVGNTGQMVKPPFVEAIYEGEQYEFTGESDELRVKHTKDPLNKHRAAGDTSKILAVYSRWYLKSGTVDHVMTWPEILAHRDKYSKSFQDADKVWGNKPARKDSFWHKEPVKAAFKTLIRDAVNRDKVPISRVDRGYVLDAARAEREEWTETDAIDAEFSLAECEAVESESIETTTALAVAPQHVDHEALFDRYIEDLARSESVAATGAAYDAVFGPDSAIAWPPGYDARAAQARNDRNAEIRAKQ